MKAKLTDSLIQIESQHPWYSDLGIYHHYHTIISHQNTTIQFVPTFLFGVSSALKTRLYPDLASINSTTPVRGMLTRSVTMDRLIIQSFMSLVAFTVVILLKLKY